MTRSSSACSTRLQARSWTPGSSPSARSPACHRGPTPRSRYYFSIIPFNWVENDWTSVYAGLAASTTPIVLSVGLLPLVPPPELTQQLLGLTTFYGRLAREDEIKGGLYYGEQKIPPDAFAVEAEQVFQDLVRRCSQRAFGLRIQLASPGLLAPGVTEAVAAAISPLEVGGDNHMNGTRAAASYEIRQPGSEHEAALAEWNLRAIDFRPIGGRADIWQRPDPPHPGLQALAVFGRRPRRQLRVPASRGDRRGGPWLPSRAEDGSATPKRSPRPDPGSPSAGWPEPHSRSPCRSPASPSTHSSPAAPAAARRPPCSSSCASSGSTTAFRSW